MACEQQMRAAAAFARPKVGYAFGVVEGTCEADRLKTRLQNLLTTVVVRANRRARD